MIIFACFASSEKIRPRSKLLDINRAEISREKEMHLERTDNVIIRKTVLLSRETRLKGIFRLAERSQKKVLFRNFLQVNEKTE